MKSPAFRISTYFLATAVSIASPLAYRALGAVLRVPQVSRHADAGQAEVIVRGPWGSEPGQFGKVDEASRPGPMDFAVAGDTLYVLDPVNGRVQLFGLDGSFRREIPIGTQTADFLCVDANGNVTVLDAFSKREFKTFSVAGQRMAHARLPGTIGLPSAILADGHRVWIEERHNHVHEVDVAGNADGAPARVVRTLTGRPLGPNHSPVHAKKDGTHDVLVRKSAGGTLGEPITLRFPRQVASIVALECDDSGRVYLAAACSRETGSSPWKTEIVLVVISPSGGLAGSFHMPDAYVTDHYRKLFVTPSGDVIQMQTAEDEVRFVRWRLQAHGKEGGS